MNPNRQKPAVTLEDLLRLKRAERPPAEFWSRFDRELRAKQLAAIVEPRPWWAPLIRLGTRLSHYQLPVGAAAILTLSVLTVREYRTVDSVSPYAPEVAVRAVPQSEPALSRSETAAPAQLLTVAAESPAMPVAAPAEIAVVAPSQPQADRPQSQPAPASSAVSREMPVGERAVAPSARYLAANLSTPQDTDLGFSETLVRPARAASTRQPVREPLAQVVSPSDARLARLLAPGFATVASVSESALRNTDRVTRHLTEDRLYDTMSRFNARGAGVLVKF
jgi:hypothetical protein